MLSKIDEAENAIAAAASSVESISAQVPGVGKEVAEELRSELQGWLKQEVKKTTLRHSQCKARLRRCRQLVKSARKDMVDARNDQIVADMKDKLLEEVRPALDLAYLDAPIEKAEKSAEPFVKPSANEKTEEEMVELAAEADEALSSCREAFSSAREALFPIDSKLDADVQTKLKAVLAVEVKAATQQLAKLEDRLKRADSVVQKYRDEVKKSERVKNSSGEAIDGLEAL